MQAGLHQEMFDDIDPRPIRVVGEITIEFSEHEDGKWHSKITTPKLSTSVLRDIYKMALVVAVLQDTCVKKLDAIDRMITNNKEIAEYHNHMLAEKKNTGKRAVPVPDTEKYQTKLPFEHDTAED